MSSCLRAVKHWKQSLHTRKLSIKCYCEQLFCILCLCSPAHLTSKSDLSRQLLPYRCLISSGLGCRLIASTNRRARTKHGEEEIRELRGEAEALRADRDALARQASPHSTPPPAPSCCVQRDPASSSLASALSLLTSHDSPAVWPTKHAARPHRRMIAPAAPRRRQVDDYKLKLSVASPRLVRSGVNKPLTIFDHRSPS